MATTETHTTMPISTDKTDASHHTGSTVNGQHPAVHHHNYTHEDQQYMVPPFAHHGSWKPYEHRKFANPAPLGLCAFALTTFVLSAINMHARDVTAPNVVVPLAFGYGGFVQLLAGMWEMAVGNTFGATALSSYGGFWIAYAILLTPNWAILDAKTGPYAAQPGASASAVGFFLTGWWIFTTLLLICTLKSTVMFFLLFFTLDIAFLLLACENYASNLGAMEAKNGLQIAGGLFGMFAAFLAWYNALAGIQDNTNSFFRVPVFPFPWSEAAKEERAAKTERATV